MEDKIDRRIQKYSYGILLFTGNGLNRKYLIIQNRDTEAFIYFFLAWNMEKWRDAYMFRVVSGFSRDELNRLLFYPFDLIYTDLYVNHQQGSFQKQYKRALSNYNYFHSRYDWVQKCYQFVQTTEISWGFSKGRIEKDEEPLRCALRELEEEVSIHRDQFRLCNDMQPVEYVNEKPLFKTNVNVCLFPGKCTHEIPIQYQCFDDTIRRISVSNEVLHARWVNVKEAIFLLPKNLYRVLYEFHMATCEN